MQSNKRSQIVTQGVQRSPNRAMLRAVGFKDADFKKPILGIANGYSTITPCNLGLNDLTARAETAARKAGATSARKTWSAGAMVRGSGSSGSVSRRDSWPAT